MAFDDFDVKLDLGGVVNDPMGVFHGLREVNLPR